MKHKSVVEKYLKMANEYLSGETEAEEFKEAYLRAFKNEEVFFEEEVFYHLNEIFSALERFSPHCKLEEETDIRISKPTMTQVVRKSSEKLQELIRG